MTSKTELLLPSSLPDARCADSGSRRNVRPIVYSSQQRATRRSQLSSAHQPLKVAPYQPIRKSLLSLVWYKLHVETSAILLEPWERLVSAMVAITIIGYSAYLTFGAYNWFTDVLMVELAS